MKQFKQVIFSVLIVFLSAGCDKFLNIDPPYTQDVENFFETKEDYERALTGAYD